MKSSSQTTPPTTSQLPTRNVETFNSLQEISWWIISSWSRKPVHILSFPQHRCIQIPTCLFLQYFVMFCVCLFRGHVFPTGGGQALLNGSHIAAATGTHGQDFRVQHPKNSQRNQHFGKRWYLFQGGTAKKLPQRVRSIDLTFHFWVWGLGYLQKILMCSPIRDAPSSACGYLIKDFYYYLFIFIIYIIYIYLLFIFL